MRWRRRCAGRSLSRARISPSSGSTRLSPQHGRSWSDMNSTPRGSAATSSRSLSPCQAGTPAVCALQTFTGRLCRGRCSLVRALNTYQHLVLWMRRGQEHPLFLCPTTFTARQTASGPRASTTCAAPTSARPSSSASSTGSTHPRLRPRTSPSCSPRCAARTRSPDWCSRSSTPLHMPAKAVWHCMASPSRSGCTVPSPTSVPGPAPRTLQAHAERRCPMPSATSSRSPSLSSYWLPRRSCLQSCVRRRWRCWCRRHP
mmetsp:Transcript_147282/g.410273  ORF Transcript_147282/g.410273 Transcript_147282/m.410273 type:complete len:258 (+) Transcript_147282:378-1151(+)